MERQRWLSRLLAATPRVLLDVADARRWQVMEQAAADEKASKPAAAKSAKPPRDEPKVPAFAAIDQPVAW
jgi:hypothetical protein